VTGRVILRRSVGEGARALVGDQFRAWAASRRAVLQSEDPEAVHQFRVTLRRLRTTLKLYRLDVDWAISPEGRQALKRLASRSGDCRDLEIQRTWLGARAGEMTRGAPTSLMGLIDRVTADERATRTRLRRAIGRSFPLVRREMLRAARRPGGRVTPEPRETANMGLVLRRLVTETTGRVEAALGAIQSVTDVTGGHRARIAVKQLRYLLEPVADELEGGKAAVARLADLQATLGELHDRQVIEALVAQAPGIGLGVLQRRSSVEARLFYARLREDRQTAWRRAVARLTIGARG
jgi:CHAD domain-containing protein